MRLLLPGYQGNMNVKYLRRIKAVDQPVMSYFETKNYSQILPGGKTWRFHFLMEATAIECRYSPGATLTGVTVRGSPRRGALRVRLAVLDDWIGNRPAPVTSGGGYSADLHTRALQELTISFSGDPVMGLLAGTDTELRGVDPEIAD
jgi:hypothetical protein